MAKEAFKKGRRACCFCGGFDLSKEHIWPRWAEAMLPHGPDHVRRKLEGWGPNPKVTSLIARQGPPKTIRIYCVCKACNNGWMSDMEEAVRPWLEPILKQSAVELSEQAQAIISQYFTLKCMVADQSIVGENVFSKGEREAFRLNRDIPQGTYVILYRYEFESDPIVVQYNKETEAIMFVPEGDGIERKGLANITLRFGDLFAQVLLLRNAEAEFEGKPGFAFRVHPPVNHALRWPPLFRLQTADAYMLQHSLEAARIAFDRNPTG